MFRREDPCFWKYPKFLKHGVGQEEGSLHAKTSAIRLAILVELRLATDRHRHRAIASSALAWRHAVKHTLAVSDRCVFSRVRLASENNKMFSKSVCINLP